MFAEVKNLLSIWKYSVLTWLAASLLILAIPLAITLVPLFHLMDIKFIPYTWLGTRTRYEKDPNLD